MCRARLDRTGGAQDVVVFNLCTLYDLESDNSAAKKKALLAIISQFASDDFDSSAVKV